MCRWYCSGLWLGGGCCAAREPAGRGPRRRGGGVSALGAFRSEVLCERGARRAGTPAGATERGRDGGARTRAGKWRERPVARTGGSGRRASGGRVREALVRGGEVREEGRGGGEQRERGGGGEGEGGGGEGEKREGAGQERPPRGPGGGGAGSLGRREEERKRHDRGGGGGGCVRGRQRRSWGGPGTASPRAERRGRISEKEREREERGTRGSGAGAACARPRRKSSSVAISWCANGSGRRGCES